MRQVSPGHRRGHYAIVWDDKPPHEERAGKDDWVHVNAEAIRDSDHPANLVIPAAESSSEDEGDAGANAKLDSYHEDEEAGANRGRPAASGGTECRERSRSRGLAQAMKDERKALIQEYIDLDKVGDPLLVELDFGFSKMCPASD